ncbi:MAG: ABC transporter permease [Candidatus Hydrogenedentota bacterium]
MSTIFTQQLSWLPQGGRALVRRELLTTLRAWAPYLSMALLLVAVSVFVLSQWPEDMADALSNAADLSQGFLQTIGLAQLATGLLLLPAVAGSAFATERDRGSYDLLRTTLISPGGMVLGKALNALGIYLLVVAATLPLLGIVFFLVGVSANALVYQALLVLTSALSCVAGGLWASARFKRTVVCITVAYVAMLTFQGLPFYIIGLFFELLSSTFFYDIPYIDLPMQFINGLADLFPGAGYGPLKLLRIVSPVHDFVFAPGDIANPLVAHPAIAYQCGLAVLFLYGALRHVRRPEETVSTPPRRRNRDTLFHVGTRRVPYYLIDPAKRPGPIPDGQNPMRLRELRFGLLGRSTTLVRIFYVFVAFDMLLFSLGALEWQYESELLGMGMMLSMSAAVVFGPALLAALFTREYTQGNLDMLRMTLLSPDEVLAGKLAGAAVNFLAMLLPAVVVGMGVTIVAMHLGAFVTWLSVLTALLIGTITLAVVGACVLSFTLTGALFTRRTVPSFVASYALCALLLIAPWFLAERAAASVWPSPYRMQQYNWNWRYTPEFDKLYGQYLLGRDIAQVASPIMACWLAVDQPGASDSFFHRPRRFLIWGVSMAVYSILAALGLVVGRRLFHWRYRPG